MIRRWHDRQRAQLRQALNYPASSIWENLGLWSDPQQSYGEAARALAMRVAETAALHADDSVLDIGPGMGDHQQRLWTDTFSIGRYYPWERATPPPPDHGWQHILAVDSAYFVPEFWPRMQALWPQVKPGGTITWTDLYLTTPLQRLPTTVRLRITSTLAAIPWAHWQTRDERISQLDALPQSTAYFEDLSDSVLGGFVRHMQWRHESEQSRRGLWLAHGTARLLKPLLEGGVIGYGLFQARRQ